MYTMITELLSGLALFLFGMKYMSDSLQQAAGEKLRGVLDRCTRTKFIGVVFGALFTAFIQSSGATTVMEVSFVNAGILTLERSVGLTFGANIGTTITSQLVSLKLTAVAPFIIFIGAVILSFFKKIFNRFFTMCIKVRCGNNTFNSLHTHHFKHFQRHFGIMRSIINSGQYMTMIFCAQYSQPHFFSFFVSFVSVFSP